MTGQRLSIYCSGVELGCVDMLLSRVGKRQRANFASIAGFSLLGIALFSMPATSGGVIAPAIAAVRSLASLIGLRSPGDRPEGAVGKARRRAAVVGHPPAHVADRGIRQRLAPRGPGTVPIFPAGSPLGVGSPQRGFTDIADIAPADGGFGFAPSLAPIAGGPFSGPGIGGAGGPGGVGGGSGSTGGIINPPLPGAVPEPGTWFMIMAGFGAIGAVSRRRWRAARRVS